MDREQYAAELVAGSPGKDVRAGSGYQKVGK